MNGCGLDGRIGEGGARSSVIALSDGVTWMWLHGSGVNELPPPL